MLQKAEDLFGGCAEIAFSRFRIHRFFKRCDFSEDREKRVDSRVIACGSLLRYAACEGDHLDTVLSGNFGYAYRRFAHRCLKIETPFACDDDIGSFERFFKGHGLEHKINARDQAISIITRFCFFRYP